MSAEAEEEEEEEEKEANGGGTEEESGLRDKRGVLLRFCPLVG